MKKIPRTAKIGRGRRLSPIWLSEEFFESNYFQIGQGCSPLRPGLNVAFYRRRIELPSQSNIRLIQWNMRLNFDSWFKRRILRVPNWIKIMFNNLCLLEWEFKTRHSRSAILFGKSMRRLNQISRTYSFESTKISIWFGACKMQRLNQALLFNYIASQLLGIAQS